MVYRCHPQLPPQRGDGLEQTSAWAQDRCAASAALTGERRTYKGRFEVFAYTRDECVPYGLPSQPRDGAKLGVYGFFGFNLEL
jgi:hypothetical protein